MKINRKLLASCLFAFTGLFAQEDKIENLEEVTVSSSRIDVPFSKESRTIKIITSEEIKTSTASNLADLLQLVAGVDVRKRGVDGMQSDLYIRGGSFDQTLLLIDGIKTENPQTGHHTMNMMIPLENIERIEIIKGPAARVFGQNAFTGAINIVTKDKVETSLTTNVAYGSFDHSILELTGAVNLSNSSHQVHVSRNASDGYRYNTDFENYNYFIKSRFNTDKTPIDLLATLVDRKFGANGFYANPSFTDQYEETTSSLVGISSTISKNDFIFKPKLYWKRGQDMFELFRGKPEIYRNLHITNKVGGALDGSYQSKFGVTGFGIDVARVFISSNNLGDRNRTMITGFLEQKFLFANDKLDVTPGVAMTYYSDFDFQAFPGVDVGYEVNDKARIYANAGYTYRIPTYTDLFYSDPTTIGNANLNPESAFTTEFGTKINTGNVIFDAALFYRNSDDLIDYVKENEDDPWQAQNIANVSTMGFETSVDYFFQLRNYKQILKVGYNYLDDDIKESSLPFSRYSLNSMKHQFIAGFDSQFMKYLQQSIAFRFVERPDGTTYNLVDASLIGTINNFQLKASFNNIFNEEYTETSLVPMPEFNVLYSLKYTFK